MKLKVALNTKESILVTKGREKLFPPNRTKTMTKRQRREQKAAQMTIAANDNRNMNEVSEYKNIIAAKEQQPERIEIINADAVQTREVRSQRMVKEIEAVSTGSVSSISSIEYMHNIRF